MSNLPTLETIELRLGQTEMHLGRLDEKIDGVANDISKLSVLIAKVPQCPKPGLCVVLEEKIKLDEHDKAEMKARLSAVEHNQAYAEGFGRGMIWVTTMCGGTLGAFIVFVLTRIFK